MRKFRDRSNPKISVMSYTKCIECGKMLYPNEIYDAKYCKECAEITKTAKELSYIQCVHCHQYFPQERIVTFGKLNLNYCTFCSSKLIKCKYCGEKFIPTEFDELVCPECFDSKSKTCIKCGMDFIPNERHHNICFDCFISENDTETADNLIKNSQEDTILEISEINVDSLVSLFTNLDKRTETIEYLAKQGYAAVDPLIECLGEENEVVRNYALKTLVLIGQPAVESLIDGLEYINDNQRLSCVKALGEIGDTSAIDPIIEILQNDYVFKIRRTAVEALALINNESALEPILELLKEETDPRIRTTCALAVGNLANENGLKVLIETLNDDDKSVAKASAASIIKIKDEKYLQELLNNLPSETQHVSDEKEHVFDIIKFINEKLENKELIFEIEELVKSFDSINDSNFVKQLINCIEDCKAEDRIILIDLLGEVENPLVINALIKYLKDDDTRIRWSAKESLGKLASTNLNEVIKLIDHEDSDVRYVIVYILTEMDDDRVINPLLKSLYDSDPDIRFKTLEFLNTIDDERISSYVNGLVNDPNVGIRIFAIDIISKKGDGNSLEYLYDALSDEDYKVRKEAKNAIRMIKSRFKGNLGPEIRKKKIRMDINVSKTEISVHENKNPMKLLSELRKK